MNKLLIISLILAVVTIGSITYQTTAAPKCPAGSVTMAHVHLVNKECQRVGAKKQLDKCICLKHLKHNSFSFNKHLTLK